MQGRPKALFPVLFLTLTTSWDIFLFQSTVNLSPLATGTLTSKNQTSVNSKHFFIFIVISSGHVGFVHVYALLDDGRVVYIGISFFLVLKRVNTNSALMFCHNFETFCYVQVVILLRVDKEGGNE